MVRYRYGLVGNGNAKASQVAANRLFPAVGQKKHRPYPTIINNAATLANKVETLGETTINISNFVVHTVNQGRHLQCQLEHAGLTDCDTILHGGVLLNNHALLDVVTHLPAVT